jgi:methionine aminopeptidase
LPPLVDGDSVKIDMGVHIDGYIAVGAHTVIVGQTATEAPVTGPRANVIHASWAAAEIAASLIRAGNTNAEVSNAMKTVSGISAMRLC